MPATSYKLAPGETMFGGGAGVMFLGRRSKPSPEPQTPKSQEQLLADLKARTGYEMDKDDPMRPAAAAVESMMESITQNADRQAIERQSQVPLARLV